MISFICSLNNLLKLKNNTLFWILQDQTKRPLGYPCKFWNHNKDNPVQISYIIPTGNLKAHGDGSTQARCSTLGLPCWLKAQAAVVKALPSVVEIQAKE